MEFVISIALGLISTIIRTIFYDAFLPRKKPLIPFWIVVVVFSALTVGNSYLFAAWPLIKQICTTAISILIITLLYEASILRNLFVTVLYIAISSLTDAASSYALIIISGLPIGELREGVQSFLIGSGMSYIFLLLVALIIKKIRHSRRDDVSLTYKDFLQLLIFPVVSAFIFVAMLNEAVYTGYASPLLFVSVIGLLATNIVSVVIMDKLDRERKSHEENSLLRHQIRSEMNNINALMEVNEAQIRIAHDHANHLHLISSLIEKGDIPEAKTYLDKLITDREDSQYVIYTNNPVADAVLNLKYLLAKRSKIKMTVEVNDLAEFPLKSAELATVLANLLDNAIEACVNVKENPRITLKVLLNGDESIISVRNTTAYPVEIEDNAVKTTKTHGSLHGYGLKNVTTVLSQHGYDYAIGYSDGWFQFTTVF